MAKALHVSLENHHRAVDDAGCTAEIFEKFVDMLKERDILDLEGLNEDVYKRQDLEYTFLRYERKC